MMEKKKKSKTTQPRLSKFYGELKKEGLSDNYLAVEPVVKWAGGKRGLLKEYKAFFPRTFKKYYEPFFGGGAVFFYLFTRDKISTAKISDINKEIMNMYVVIKNKVEELIEELKSGKYVNEKDVFYRIRAEEPTDPVIRAARLIYLNRTCYNGLYRVNKQGKFNVPFGRYPKNVRIFDEQNLRNVSESLKNVELSSEDFEEAVKDAQEGDFVYFDPPYVPLTKTADFTDYTSEGFGLKEQERLAKVFKELNERGCLVMESNSSAPIIWKLYAGFIINEVHAKRFISSDPNGRGGVKETVIRNYDNQEEK
ncbi:MAG: DNA adenine methylase [Candidatus Heimdallarchaeaceae archaeon]